MPESSVGHFVTPVLIHQNLEPDRAIPLRCCILCRHRSLAF